MIMLCEMKDRFEITAVWNEKCYHHFGIHPSVVSLYGDKVEDIETLTMKICEDQSIPAPNGEYKKADYWGWFENEDEILSLTNMVYPQYFLLNMCFPYGIKSSEEHGKGKAYRLEVVKN